MSPSDYSSKSNSPPSSSSSSSSWLSWWDTFQDDQRMERLQICQQLDMVLEQCRQKNAADVNAIEQLSPGLRVMKYFGWRGILAPTKMEIDGTTTLALDSQVQEQVQFSCSREQHAVWACRSVAIGCGKDLAALKQCFEQEDGAERILLHPQTNYESSSSTDKSVTKNLPCRDAQRVLGNCVTKGAQELYQRRRQRSKAEVVKECQ